VDKGLAPGIIEWISAQQVLLYVDLATGEECLAGCGFRGGSSNGQLLDRQRNSGGSCSSGHRFPGELRATVHNRSVSDNVDAGPGFLFAASLHQPYGSFSICLRIRVCSSVA